MEFEYFGQLLHAKRKEADLTQEELCELTKKFLKVSKSYISTIENQRKHSITGAVSSPENDVVESLVNALNSKLSGGQQIEMDAALILAGYAPRNTSKIKKPTSIAEFLDALEAMGIEQFQFRANLEAIENYTEDEYQELLERIQADINITLKRKIRGI